MQFVIWQLAIYEFAGTSTGDNQFNAVTAQPSNAVFSNFTRTNVDWNAGANVFNSKTWNTGSTIDLGEYVEFTITPSACYVLNLTSITFSYQKSNTVPRHRS